jgi:uncharacterized protein YecE (DUF72 family)
LRKHRVAFCIHDIGHDGKCPVQATASLAYVRFHGSDAKKYQGKYTTRELEAWAKQLHRLARETDDVWAFFNNDTHGYAVENARQLTGLIESS